MIRALCLAVALTMAGALPGAAQDLPALYDVQGVAADDVLNIRAAPQADAEIVGTLAPDAKRIEVIAAVDGWAMVNTGEGTGYAKLEYLAPSGGPAWQTFEAPLSCFGTEPFWGLDFDPAAMSISLNNFETPAQVMAVKQIWLPLPWSPVSAIGLEDGTVVIRPEECSDGMSDQTYGIAMDMFLTKGDLRRYSGCCSLELRTGN